MNIYKFGSEESLRQDIHLTQGVNESYGSFTCRVHGIKVSFREPDRFLRDMTSESSNSLDGSFKDNIASASISTIYDSLSGDSISAAQRQRQRYNVNMGADTLKQSSSLNNNREAQTLIQQPEIQSRDRETDDTQKNTVFQRLLNFLTRCFIPCINVKK